MLRQQRENDPTRTVEQVMRRPWSKKAPLELSHPTRPLVYGQTSVFLFARVSVWG
jgi:hypothetical protein